MKWSKLRQAVEERFAESVQGRIQIHQTRYGPGFSHLANRAWITWDSVEIATWSTLAWWLDVSGLTWEISKINHVTNPNDPSQRRQYDVAHDEAKRIVHLQGNYSCQQFLENLQGYLDLSVDDALASDDPLLRGLVTLDRRFGKRRLQAFVPETEHPLVQLLYLLRCEAEGLLVAEEN